MRAVRGNARRLDRAGRAGRRRRRRRRVRQRRLDRRRARRRALQHQARDRGIYRPGARAADPGARAARSRCSTSAPTPRCAPSTSCSSRSWAPRWRSRCSASSARASALLSNGEEPTKGTPLVARGPRGAAGAPRTRRRCDFVGNVEGTDITDGAADVVVTDGFTGNVALKLIEGVSQATARRGPRRGDVVAAREGRRPAAAAARCAACATRSTPRARAAPTCSGCASSASSRTGASPATASRRRSCWPRAASPATSSGARTRRSRPPARCAAAAPASAASDYPDYGSPAMTREEVFTLIQAHLADELDLDPARIDESTRFKEDLEADSLDLYTLVQELEDSYGVKMSDEQAAQDPHRRPGRRLRPRARPDRLSPEAPHRPARRAAGGAPPAGLHARLVDRAARRTPTRGWRSWATACWRWRSRRTSTRAWRPSASAPGG